MARINASLGFTCANHTISNPPTVIGVTGGISDNRHGDFAQDIGYCAIGARRPPAADNGIDASGIKRRIGAGGNRDDGHREIGGGWFAQLEQRHIIVFAIAVVLGVHNNSAQGNSLAVRIGTLNVMDAQIHHQRRGSLTDDTMRSSQCPTAIDK